MYEELIKEYKSLLRKAKINHYYLNNITFDENNINVKRIPKKRRKALKNVSKYGCIVGSELIIVHGLLPNGNFKDIDLIVNQEMFDIIKKKYKFYNHESYNAEIDMNSSGYFYYNNKGEIIDLFIKEDEPYYEVDGVKFSKNILKTLSLKLEIFKNYFSDGGGIISAQRYFPLKGICDVLSGRIEPTVPIPEISLWEKFKNFYF